MLGDADYDVMMVMMMMMVVLVLLIDDDDDGLMMIEGGSPEERSSQRYASCHGCVFTLTLKPCQEAYWTSKPDLKYASCVSVNGV